MNEQNLLMIMTAILIGRNNDIMDCEPYYRGKLVESYVNFAAEIMDNVLKGRSDFGREEECQQNNC